MNNCSSCGCRWESQAGRNGSLVIHERDYIRRDEQIPSPDCPDVQLGFSSYSTVPLRKRIEHTVGGCPDALTRLRREGTNIL